MSGPAIVASNATGRTPEVGQEIAVTNKIGITTWKRRVLVGWNHQNDTPNGLRSGKIWGWRSEGNHFQVYDEDFNRSESAGEVRFCGPANFTMVRMFHPFWAIRGRPPRDMHSKDKETCRLRYDQFMRQWRIDNNLPVERDPGNPIQPPNVRGRASRRSRGGRVAGIRTRRPRRYSSTVPLFEQQGYVRAGRPDDDGSLFVEDENDTPDHPPLPELPDETNLNEDVEDAIDLTGDFEAELIQRLEEHDQQTTRVKQEPVTRSSIFGNRTSDAVLTQKNDVVERARTNSIIDSAIPTASQITNETNRTSATAVDVEQQGEILPEQVKRESTAEVWYWASAEDVIVIDDD